MRVWVLVVLVVLAAAEATAHGRLRDPPARGSLWRFGFDVPRNYIDHQLWCGGFQVQWGRNGGRCGECGDPWHLPRPRPNEAGGRYGLGIVSRKYTSGQVIEVEIDLTSNHRGWFEFRICPTNDPKKTADQACFNKHTLQLASGSGSRFTVDDGHFFSIRLQLPHNFTCSHCVLQWHYYTANRWGTCRNGTEGIGCGPQETFRNCADVMIRDPTEGGGDDDDLNGNITKMLGNKPLPGIVTHPINWSPNSLNQGTAQRKFGDNPELKESSVFKNFRFFSDGGYQHNSSSHGSRELENDIPTHDQVEQGTYGIPPTHSYSQGGSPGEQADFAQPTQWQPDIYQDSTDDYDEESETENDTKSETWATIPPLEVDSQRPPETNPAVRAHYKDSNSFRRRQESDQTGNFLNIHNIPITTRVNNQHIYTLTPTESPPSTANYEGSNRIRHEDTTEDFLGAKPTTESHHAVGGHVFADPPTNLPSQSTQSHHPQGSQAVHHAVNENLVAQHSMNRYSAETVRGGKSFPHFENAGAGNDFHQGVGHSHSNHVHDEEVKLQVQPTSGFVQFPTTSTDYFHGYQPSGSSLEVHHTPQSSTDNSQHFHPNAALTDSHIVQGTSGDSQSRPRNHYVNEFHDSFLDHETVGKNEKHSNIEAQRDHITSPTQEIRGPSKESPRPFNDQSSVLDEIYSNHSREESLFSIITKHAPENLTTPGNRQQNIPPAFSFSSFSIDMNGTNATEGIDHAMFFRNQIENLTNESYRFFMPNISMINSLRIPYKVITRVPKTLQGESVHSGETQHSIRPTQQSDLSPQTSTRQEQNLQATFPAEGSIESGDPGSISSKDDELHVSESNSHSPYANQQHVFFLFSNPSKISDNVNLDHPFKPEQSAGKFANDQGRTAVLTGDDDATRSFEHLLNIFSLNTEKYKGYNATDINRYIVDYNNANQLSLHNATNLNNNFPNSQSTVIIIRSRPTNHPEQIQDSKQGENIHTHQDHSDKSPSQILHYPHTPEAVTTEKVLLLQTGPTSTLAPFAHEHILGSSTNQQITNDRSIVTPHPTITNAPYIPNTSLISSILPFSYNTSVNRVTDYPPHATHPITTPRYNFPTFHNLHSESTLSSNHVPYTPHPSPSSDEEYIPNRSIFNAFQPPANNTINRTQRTINSNVGYGYQNTPSEKLLREIEGNAFHIQGHLNNLALVTSQQSPSPSTEGAAIDTRRNGENQESKSKIDSYDSSSQDSINQHRNIYNDNLAVETGFQETYSYVQGTTNEDRGSAYNNTNQSPSSSQHVTPGFAHLSLPGAHTRESSTYNENASLQTHFQQSTDYNTFLNNNFDAGLRNAHEHSGNSGQYQHPRRYDFGIAENPQDMEELSDSELKKRINALMYEFTWMRRRKDHSTGSSSYSRYRTNSNTRYITRLSPNNETESIPQSVPLS